MVSKLRYFRSKKSFIKWARKLGLSRKEAEAKWKGPGYYYHRGKGYICKYSKARDLKRGGKIGRGPWRHTHDFVKAVKKLRAYAKRKAKAIAKAKKKATLGKIAAAASRKAERKVDREALEIAEYLWSQIPREYKEGSERKWTYISVIALAKYVKRKAVEQGVDWRAIDWAMEIDWKQGYSYAKSFVDSVFREVSYEGYTEKDVEAMMKYYEMLADSLSEYSLF